MICALCLNPCVDKTITINGFNYGEMNRIQKVKLDGAGKGVHVAIACSLLGHDVHLIGFGAKVENLVQQRIESYGIDCTMVEAFDSIRVNTKVLNNNDQVITEFNESGGAVTKEHIETVVRHLVDAAKVSDYMVLTGSMPPGCSPSLYADIIKILQKYAPTCRCVLDAEGTALAQGIEAMPYMVKPNRYELELYAEQKLNSLKDIREAGQKLLEKGIKIVIISMGGDGAMLVTKDGCYYAPAMDVDVRGTVGAGDSMTVGMLCALEDGLSAVDAFRRAVAAASSAVTAEGSGLIQKSLYQDLIPNVTLEVLCD